MHDTLHQAAQAIRSADALLIGAGAGMGVDSGFPDFRGNDGFWKAYPPFRGRSFVQMANPQWFIEDPAVAWGFYGHRLNLYRSRPPHEGYAILQKWAREKLLDSFVFTSNVDGHFARAGFDADRIMECHGSILHAQCSGPCSDAIWPAHDLAVTVDEVTFRAVNPLPHCPRCGRVARPNVLMFNDGNWLGSRVEEQYERYRDWQKLVTGANVVAVELGAGTAIPTVRSQCESYGSLVRINPREPETPAGGISLAMGALEALRLIDAA